MKKKNGYPEIAGCYQPLAIASTLYRPAPVPRLRGRKSNLFN